MAHFVERLMAAHKLDVPSAMQPKFTLDRLTAAVNAARMRGARGPPANIWVDIFEAEHLLRRAGESVERLTRLLEDYAYARS